MCLLATDIGGAGEKDTQVQDTGNMNNVGNVDRVVNVDVDQSLMLVIPPDDVSINEGKNA